MICKYYNKFAITCNWFSFSSKGSLSDIAVTCRSLSYMDFLLLPLIDNFLFCPFFIDIIFWNLPWSSVFSFIFYKISFPLKLQKPAWPQCSILDYLLWTLPLINDYDRNLFKLFYICHFGACYSQLCGMVFAHWMLHGDL